MNAKRERPASLTSSLLARKGEAAPSRLADGSAPRDVMALHEEIVARLAEEIEQEGLFRHEDEDGHDVEMRAVQEPAFDFGDDELGSAPAVDDAADETPAAAEAAASASDNPPYDDDTDFGYDAEAEADEDAAEEPVAAAAAPMIAAPQLSAVRPGALRADVPPPSDVDDTDTPHEMAAKAAPAAAPSAAKSVPQSAFVTLRPSDGAGPSAPPAKVAPARMIASLPMAFAVMVAIAIGGGLGLWVAGSLVSHAPAPAAPTVASDVPPPRVDDGTSVAPLDVPDTGKVAMAPIDTPAAPAAPALRKSAPIPAAPVEAPMPTPAPEHKTVAKAPAPAPAAPASSAALTGAYGIQLLATPAEKDAEDSWTRLSAKHKATLGKLPHEVVRADLGAKGVFYRLRAGSFANRADAKAVCAALAAAKQDCLVIKR